MWVDAHAQRLGRAPRCRQVLRGQRLGRRHQRALAAVLDGAQQGVHGHGRLARADVALQQALHRDAAGDVAVDVGDRPPLARAVSSNPSTSRNRAESSPG